MCVYVYVCATTTDNSNTGHSCSSDDWWCSGALARCARQCVVGSRRRNRTLFIGNRRRPHVVVCAPLWTASRTGRRCVCRLVRRVCFIVPNSNSYAGVFEPAALHGTVWLDANADGVMDANEHERVSSELLSPCARSRATHTLQMWSCCCATRAVRAAFWRRRLPTQQASFRCAALRQARQTHTQSPRSGAMRSLMNSMCAVCACSLRSTRCQRTRASRRVRRATKPHSFVE